ncbi:hypothetical protein BDA99DRAFT_499558 [Phascolomyces articulosus]|uniref:Uncharacterized protein n=1 Tax=Phascolomyces articulosus TaxID=60185 RepID=A0AAD5PHW8_9FUNG|nr:hypothetical protein BDA99DRAFT_499558 [Phascolomyces articulosus]
MTLRGLDCVSDESLYYISNIQSLRKLKLSRLANVTPLGLQHIMYNKNLSLNINL